MDATGQSAECSIFRGQDGDVCDPLLFNLGPFRDFFSLDIASHEIAKAQAKTFAQLDLHDFSTRVRGCLLGSSVFTSSLAQEGGRGEVGGEDVCRSLTEVGLQASSRD